MVRDIYLVEKDKRNCNNCLFNNSCIFRYDCILTGEHLHWHPMTNGQKLGMIADRCSGLVGDLDDNEMNEEKTMKNDYTACYKRNLFTIDKLEIKDVIFSGPCTIVKWSDGDKTIVRCENEYFDREKGLAMAICKKMMGTNKTKSNYNDIFKKWIKEEEVKSNNHYYSVKTYAKKFGISETKVRNMCRDGKLNAKKQDGAWLICNEELISDNGIIEYRR